MLDRAKSISEFIFCQKMEIKSVEVQKSKESLKTSTSLVTKPVAIVAPSIDPHFSPGNPYGEYSPSITRRWNHPPSPIHINYFHLLKNIGTVFLNGKELPVCPVEAMPRDQFTFELQSTNSNLMNNLELSPVPSPLPNPIQNLWRRYSI